MDRNNSLVYAALIVGSLSFGFWAGQRSTTPPFLKPSVSSRTTDKNSPTEGSDGEDSDGDGDISALRIEDGDNCKMVFVVRDDLGMTSGKIAAQCSHAALACFKQLKSQNPVMLRQWERAGQTKIALQCGSEEELLVMQAQAQSLHLCAKSIQDAGRTQIAAGSRTVLGIAGPSRLVNQITGRLRLL